MRKNLWMRNTILGIMCLLTSSMSAQADKWQEKVSPLLRQQVAKHRMEARAATRGEQPENYLGALVKLAEGQDGSVLRREGTILLDSLDGIYIALLPASRIPAMANSQQVVAMEARQRSSLNMDVTHITTGADKGITVPTTVNVYTLNGQKVFSTQTADGIVTLPNLPAAVYAVQCGTLGSSLIRM